jgi:hypothetical protein
LGAIVLEELRNLQPKLQACAASLRKKYPSFDDAFSSYTAQYGEDSVKVYEPFKISETIDPVTVILGRTTPLFYRDSKRGLTGTLSSVTIESGETYILGRRELIDSKLILWSPTEEIEIEHYNDRARIFPSRIHAGIFALESGEVLFADLGSTSGSILTGESVKPEPFIVVYSTATAGVRRVVIPSKYPLT